MALRSFDLRRKALDYVHSACLFDKNTLLIRKLIKMLALGDSPTGIWILARHAI